MFAMLSMKTLKLFTILLPPVLIGGFEYIRHDFLLHELSMETGNLYITLLTLVLSYLFATWMFRRIEVANQRLAQEQAKRAVYEERERLAQELHDNIAQILFFLGVQLKKGQLDEARSAVSEIDHHLRQAIFNLRTAPEEGADLRLRLESWLEEWSKLSGIAVDRSIELAGGGIPAAWEVQLFSIIREAFMNIRKHSLADHAALELTHVENGRWELRILDNGIGLEALGQGGVTGKHYGLTMLRKRATELGAEVVIRSMDGGGTELIVTGTLARKGEGI
jgi:nitrate/nitrite-specific signal transduction histidine kinase